MVDQYFMLLMIILLPPIEGMALYATDITKMQMTMNISILIGDGMGIITMVILHCLI